MGVAGLLMRIAGASGKIYGTNVLKTMLCQFCETPHYSAMET
jgi:hypothetical protein